MKMDRTGVLRRIQAMRMGGGTGVQIAKSLIEDCSIEMAIEALIAENYVVGKGISTDQYDVLHVSNQPMESATEKLLASNDPTTLPEVTWPKARPNNKKPAKKQR